MAVKINKIKLEEAGFKVERKENCCLITRANGGKFKLWVGDIGQPHTSISEVTEVEVDDEDIGSYCFKPFRKEAFGGVIFGFKEVCLHAHKSLNLK